MRFIARSGPDSSRRSIRRRCVSSWTDLASGSNGSERSWCTYRGVPIPGQRIDLIVEGCVLVELKAAARIDVAHEAKVVSYLRTTGLRLGLLLNFDGRTMKEGLKRIVI